MKLSLIIPSFGTHPDNLRRTIESCKGLCDETVVISTSFFIEDKSMFAEMVDKVVQLEWNHVFKHGFGDMMNQATAHAKNDWLLLFGVSETFAETGCDLLKLLSVSASNSMFRCNHDNDINTWKRIWNRNGDTRWSGLIHEEIVGGRDCGVIFRMQDTPKTPKEDKTQQEALRWLKAVMYHIQYWRLLNDSSLLGGTDPGWLAFVNGSRESIIEFRESHHDLISPCLSGDLSAFLRAVDARMDKGEEAKGVNFEPTGQPMTEEVV